MKRERLGELADFIAPIPTLEEDDERAFKGERYDQTSWHRRNGCGTACCLGGWTIMKWGNPEQCEALASDHMTWQEINDLAQELLGIDRGDANVLFHGQPLVEALGRQPSGNEAAATIRHWLEGNTLDWYAANGLDREE